MSTHSNTRSAHRDPDLADDQLDGPDDVEARKRALLPGASSATRRPGSRTIREFTNIGERSSEVRAQFMR